MKMDETKWKWVRRTIMSVLILGGAYLLVGYLIYDSLSDIHGRCRRAMAINTPTTFTDTSDYWEGSPIDPPSYRMDSYELVEFPSRQEGIDIMGWYVEVDADAPTIIVVHGLGGCRHAVQQLVPAGMLTEAEFNALIIDLRDAGTSSYEDGRSSIGNEEHLDVLGARDWLVNEKGISPLDIGIFGNSLGAATSLIAFSQEPTFAAVWVDSPYDNLPQIIREELDRGGYPQFLYYGGVWAARIWGGDNLLAYNPNQAIVLNDGRPIYIVHGTADTRVGVHHSRQLRDLAAQVGNENVTVWIVDGVDHLHAIGAVPQAYEERLVNFFTEAFADEANGR